MPGLLSSPSLAAFPIRANRSACTLAQSPKVIRYIEGFSHFATSMTAPTYFRLEQKLPGGTLNHWETPPFHGARPFRPLRSFSSVRVCILSMT